MNEKNKPTVTQEDVDRYREIIERMVELMDEAKQIARKGSRFVSERAKAYCHAHIEMALTDEHSYLGSDVSMSKIADELEACIEGDEDEETEEGEE